MIHILTVHWKTDRWISIQRRFFQQHLKGPYRVYAWLNDLPAVSREGFYYVCSEPVDSHAVKLNLLAEIAGLSAEGDDDVLIFVDGDAFPVAELEPLLRSLEERKLIAVQRLENDGDIQPHPCFCMTTVGFWRWIGGDWKAGFDWRNQQGKLVTDVGGNLLKQLNERQVNWQPLLRSNLRNLHPVLFGVYDNKIYHHAAGFRPARTRADGASLKHKILRKIASNAPRRYRERLRQRFFAKKLAENTLLSERIFERIKNDPLFYREFI